MTGNEVSKFLSYLRDLYPNEKPLSAEAVKTRIIFWSDALKNIAFETAMKALSTYYQTSTSGFAPQPAHILNIIRRRDRLSDAEIHLRLVRAICDSAYHAEEQFNKLPAEIRAIVGSPAELKKQAMRPQDDARIYILSVIKEYKIRSENGTLDNSLINKNTLIGEKS